MDRNGSKRRLTNEEQRRSAQREQSQLSRKESQRLGRMNEKNVRERAGSMQKRKRMKRGGDIWAAVIFQPWYSPGAI